MTRENQRKVKELNGLMQQTVKKIAKAHSLKSKQSTVYTKTNDMFYEMSFTTGFNERVSDFILDCSIWIKPLWTDDLLWDILKCSENKMKSVSLRAEGAFTFRGLKAHQCSQELSDLSVCKIETHVMSSIERFLEYKISCDTKYFYEHSEEIVYQEELYALLLFIHNEEYINAIEFTDTMTNDYFIIGNKGVRQLAVEYCEKACGNIQ